MEKNKTEIIAQIVTLLSQLVESEDEKKNESAAVSAAAPVEMLTIKECAEAVTGLSEHTIRQLVAQEKIPYMLVVGGKEVASGTVSVRPRKGEVTNDVPAEEFMLNALREIASKAR